MAFIPSRDLIQLQTRSSKDIDAIVVKISKGVDDIANALGVLEDEEEHIYIDVDGIAGRIESEDKEESNENYRDETYELGYIRDWLMSVSCLRWLPLIDYSSIEEGRKEDEGGGNFNYQDAIDDILRRAARLIAICAGKSASGRSRKVYHFECGDGEDGVSVVIQEEVLVEDSLGSRTWGSAPLLVSHLLQSHLGGHLRREDPLEKNTKQLRVLELGAGTGLVGIAISRYIDTYSTRQSQVFLTDYHADVLKNLQRNVDLNLESDKSKEEQKVQVKVTHLDWSKMESNQVQGRFDLIVAADCIYEAEHANIIKTMAQRYLLLPCNKEASSVTPTPQFILCCPLRPTHRKEIQDLEQAFIKRTPSPSSQSPTLQITHQKDLIGSDDFGPPAIRSGHHHHHYHRKGQQTQFRLYVIQWCN